MPRRFSFVALALSLLALAPASLAQWSSELLSEDAVSGRLIYAEDDHGNRLPDFGWAGYETGEAPPHVPTVQTVAPGAGDDTARIQAALDAVGSRTPDADGFRGAVELAAGEFEVAGTLWIRAGGVVLRGAGQDAETGTTIRRTGRSTEPVVVLGSDTTPPRLIRERRGDDSAVLDAVVPMAAREINVATPEAFAPGDDVVIHHPATPEWIAAVDGGGTGRFGSDWPEGEVPIAFARTITDVRGTTLSLDAPLFSALDQSLSTLRVYRRDMRGILERVGVEDLRIDIETEGTYAETHADNAVEFAGVEHGWARRVTALHFWHAGVSVQNSRYVTVQDCEALEPHSRISGSRRYNFEVFRAQMILFQGNRATNARHAYVGNGQALDSGIVFLDNVSENASESSEGHRRWGLGFLYDNHTERGSSGSAWYNRRLHLGNRGNWGTTHGWSCANCVSWNADMGGSHVVVEKPPTAQNYAIGTRDGTVSTTGPFTSGTDAWVEGTGQEGLSPRSLYLRQHEARATADLASVTLTLEGAAGWRLLSLPFPGVGLGGDDPDGTVVPGLLQPFYTAGYEGADIDESNEGGYATVFLFDEASRRFVVPESSDAVPTGVGFWAYIFEDDDPFRRGTQGSFPKTSTVHGTPLESAVDFSLSYTPGSFMTGLNLLGNPYADGLDWNDARWTRSGVSSTVFVWDPAYNGGDYRQSTAGAPGGSLTGDMIPSATGFYAFATSEDAVLSTPSPSDAKSAKSEDALAFVRLALTGRVGEDSRESLVTVTLDPDAAHGLDASDAPSFAPGAPGLRLVTRVRGDAEALSVASVPGNTELDLFAERVGTEESVDATLAWEAAAFPEGWSVTLADRQTGQRHDLTRAGSLTLALDGASALRTESDGSTVSAKSSRAAAPTPQKLQVVSGHASRFALTVSTDGGPQPGASSAFELLSPRPNPTRGPLRLAYSVAETDAVEFSVYDALGRLVLQRDERPRFSGQNEVTMDVSGLAPGAYVVRAQNRSGVQEQRFSVVR